MRILTRLLWPAAVVASMAIGIAGGTWLATAGAPIGQAAELRPDNTSTGIYTLAVSTHSRIYDNTDARVADTDELTVAPSDDQLRSVATGAAAACVELAERNNWDRSAALDCATAPAPHVLVASPANGQSAALAAALAIIDTTTDITGNITVAATGAVTVSGDRSAVSPIAGIDEKMAAAVAADVDLVIVPAGNETDARAAVRRHATAAGRGTPAVVGVGTVSDAVDTICAASAADGCVRHS